MPTPTCAVVIVVALCFSSRGNTLILLCGGYMRGLMLSLLVILYFVVVIYMVVLVSAIYGRSTSQANKEQTEIATWEKI